MAEFTANAVQRIAVGANAVFTDTNVDGCDLIMHRDGSGVIKLFPISGRCSTRYKVTFGANIAATVAAGGEVSIALTIDGEPINTTTATATPAANNEYFNVATSTYIYVRHGSAVTVGVRNISTQPIDMQNANIIITRA